MHTIQKSILKFGIISAIFYAVAALIRYQVFGSNSPSFTTAAMVTYLVFLGLIFYSCNYYKHKLDHKAEIRDLFKIAFVVIIMGELALAITQYLYLKFIEPDFFNKLYQGTKVWMDKNSKWPQEQQIELLDNILKQNNTKFKGMFMAFAQSIVIDSILAMLFIFIIKRPKQKSY